jgi:putative transposase
MILAFKYRLKDRRAKKALADHARGVNQVWNYLVARQKDIEARYHAGSLKRSWGSHFDLQKEVKGVGKELGIAQQSAQEVCKQFTISRDRNKGALRFRASFGLKRALGWVPFTSQCRQIDGNSVTYLGKSYRFFGNKRRPLPATAKGGSFAEDSSGKWWVCFHVEVDALPCGAGEVGIDLGLKTLATRSDGEKIEAPRIYRQYEQRLAVAQRAGNKNRMRRIHAKIKNCRQDFLHKATTCLAREYALIAVGNVNSSKLAKTKMAKSVLDASWSTFRSMLKYKSAGYVEVDERFTTQTCSECGSLPPSRPKGIAGLEIRAWVCSDCGASHDRDVNAARNILRLALSAQRPVEESRRAA